MAKKWTTLERLKDDMWEFERAFFKEDDFHCLIRLMFRLGACVDFTQNRVTLEVGIHKLVFSAEDIIKAMKLAMAKAEEIEQNA
ncbi:hypothetical protein IACHDJAJ_00136 [Aeromonas phage vB_AdhS_TS3]|nr:hypothetical protein IACHDJAJ_00136 [Aeromonas phage vB_AdhS_TS3]